MTYNQVFRYGVVSWLALVAAACGGGGGGGIANPGQAGGGQGASSITITVTGPTSGDNMETPDPSVVLEGTANGDDGIASVGWSNNRGGQGTASGTSTWKTGGIPLEMGENRITITARDPAGRSASHTVAIKRESGGTGSVELNWTAPTHREDGSPLHNLAGFNVYYGRMSETYDYTIEVGNPGVTTYVVDGLRPGTWHFVVSAFDTDRLESNFSNEIVRTVK